MGCHTEGLIKAADRGLAVYLTLGSSLEATGAGSAAVSPLRQRMIEDMRMRKLEPTTQTGYIRAVRKLTAYLQRSPDTATVAIIAGTRIQPARAMRPELKLSMRFTGVPPERSSA